MASDRLRVGVVAASLSRSAGGLFNSVRYSSLAMAELGHDIRVFGLEDNHSAEDVSAWEPLRPTVLTRQGPTALGYAPDLTRALLEAEVDVVHQHGIWQAVSHSVSKWRNATGRPVIIAPRGMLDPWALSQARAKKAIASALFETRNLKGAAAMHALNASEAASIRAFGLTQTVATIPNGTHLPDPARSLPRPDWAQPGKKILLFLGRLHPKKGLLPLLEAWKGLQDGNVDAVRDWHLAIAGWDDGGHEAELHQFVSENDLANSVSFIGSVFGDAKAATLAHSDAFILPSHSEGLPMSVLEAWSYRLPVFMTPACNIPEGFEAGAAVEITPDPQTIQQVLAETLGKNDALSAMGSAGYDLVQQRFAWRSIAERQISLYRSLIAGTAPLDF